MTQALTKQQPLTGSFESIVRGCIDGDISCQEKLYRHFYPGMIKICSRYTTDLDQAGLVFNNAMLKVFKGLPGYQDQGKLAAWIKTIVIHCCIDYVKQQTPFRNLPIDHLTDTDVFIDEKVFSRISAREIQHLISELPRATAAVFRLFVYEGLTHRQISIALDISEGTSKWQVNEARRLLKPRLSSYLPQTHHQHETK